MAEKIISRKFNSLQIGDVVAEGDAKYKVAGIKLYVNRTGGTDYILEQTFLSKLTDKLFGKSR